MIGGGDPFYLKFWIKFWSEIADFRSLFARSDSAVSPLRAFQLAQDEHRTLSLSPQRVARKRSVQNLNNKLR